MPYSVCHLVNLIATDYGPLTTDSKIGVGRTKFASSRQG
jgi:hypothetical protein